MIYVVTENLIVGFPDATAAKPSGNGFIVHIIGKDDSIIGNFPMRAVKYYGSELPPLFAEKYKRQEEWARMTEEERAAKIESDRKK